MIHSPCVLENQIQHYPWGQKGKDAYIPNLLRIRPEKDLPYAELWMGAHERAPSRFRINGSYIKLNEAIQRYPLEILGKKTIRVFGKSLPYLFKVLSAEHALSIQVHPDKKQAEKLHQRDPENYPDDNHKPEIAIALGPFTAIAGFRPVDQLRKMLQNTPEIHHFITKYIQENGSKNGAWLKPHFQTLMLSSNLHTEDLDRAIRSLFHRLSASGKILTEHEALFIELHRRFTGPDIGLLSLFFLNMIHLKAGQGIFLDAGIPHAYIRGNIIECMANSDNVVRAGLTGKFQDIRTLSEIVRYDSRTISVIDAAADTPIFTYAAPVSEFQVHRILLPPSQVMDRHTNDRVCILICIEGAFEIRWTNHANETRVLSFRQGDSVLIPAFLEHYDLCSKTGARIFEAAPNL
ncbi:mannose-6-phosphate isomerase, class I [bacterium]|nr:mannose-6-phosphate isomerase, class I [bacterium]